MSKHIQKRGMVMSGYMVKNRKIVIDQELYTYSIKEGVDGIDILIYKNRQLMLRLRQNWVENWGVNLYRPKAVELIIRYYQKKGIQSGLQFLSREKELFLELIDLYFPPNEQAEKALFIQRCEGFANHTSLY